VAPASAAPQSGSLTLTPSRAVGTARPDTRVGPFGIYNTTRFAFNTTASPVMLGQNRDGGIAPRTDAKSRALAAKLLEIGGRPLVLAPGGKADVGARLRHPTADHNFYGGVLVRNVPTEAARRQSIQQAFALNASLLLRPPAALQRIVLRGEEIRTEQEAEGKLRFVTSIRNAGNTDVPLQGKIRIRPENGGEIVLRRRMSIPMILPGAVVDLVTRTEGIVLPAGRYGITADVRAGARHVRTKSTFTLYGPNTVATRAGRLDDAVAEAEPDKPGEVRARWVNRGNVPFAATVVAEIRPLGANGSGDLIGRAVLRSPKVAPGARARVAGKLPALARGNYEVTLRLMDGRRELDRRAVGLSPAPRPSGGGLRAWLSEHPLWLPAVLAALLVLVLFVLLRRERMLQRRLSRIEVVLLQVAARGPDAAPARTSPEPDASRTADFVLRAAGAKPDPGTAADQASAERPAGRPAS
jgi:hypothetical protein